MVAVPASVLSDPACATHVCSPVPASSTTSGGAQAGAIAAAVPSLGTVWAELDPSAVEAVEVSVEQPATPQGGISGNTTDQRPNH